MSVIFAQGRCRIVMTAHLYRFVLSVRVDMSLIPKAPSVAPLQTVLIVQTVFAKTVFRNFT